MLSSDYLKAPSQRSVAPLLMIVIPLPVSRMKILVRYHEPRFSQKLLREFLRGGRVAKKLPAQISWSKARLLTERANVGMYVRMNFRYLTSIASPEFGFSRYGLYLGSRGRASVWNDGPKRYGLFSSEGLSNHVHLDHIVRNPVAQYSLGITLLKIWADDLILMKTKPRHVVLYLNESTDGRDFMICAYSDPCMTDIRMLESQWSRPCKQASLRKFLKWSGGGIE